jgi:predicted dehydrogenase
MKPLRFGFIGAGFIAKFYTRSLKYIRNADLSAVYAIKGAEELAGLAAQLGVGEAKVCGSIAELVKSCDVVAVLVPNFAKVPVMEDVAAACAAGAEIKGIVCDKPLARNMREANRMVELGDACKVSVAYHENQDHMEPIRAGLEQLKPAMFAAGPLVLARSAEEHGGPHEPWFWDPTRQGGGVLCDMGCHSIDCSRFILTPPGKPLDFLQPVSVTARTLLLKWGQPAYRKKLLDERGVDYSKTPAEDYATGVVEFRNPESGQIVAGQFTDSWMWDMQGLRLLMEALGPGYATRIDSLVSPLSVFIGDAVAEAIKDAENALEKATATRGLLVVHPNEMDLYGYIAELQDSVRAFSTGSKPLLDWRHGRSVTELVMAAYLSGETGKTVDMTDTATRAGLQTYIPLIQQGKGGEVLFGK